MRLRSLKHLAFAGALLIIALSLVPGNLRPHSGLPGSFEHILAYAGCGILFAFGWQNRKDRTKAMFGLMALAALMEFMQLAVPGRIAELSVAVLSAAGALIGFVIGAVSRFNR